MLCRAFFKIGETLGCDHSIESYRAVLPGDTVYYDEQGGLNFYDIFGYQLIFTQGSKLRPIRSHLRLNFTYLRLEKQE